MATKWGIVSCGKISKDFSIALKTLPECDHKIIAVAGRDLEKAKCFAEELCIPKFYGSYTEMAKDPEIDVTYIGAINPSHFPLTKLMMEHGKNVLCEKPIGMNRCQVQELIEVARAKNVFLMEALWSRFNPTYVELHHLVQSGAIGKVLHCESTFGVPMARVDRISMKKLGGGTTLDIGIYCVHLATIAFWREKPERITAVGLLNEDGVDSSATVVMEYTGGRTASFTYSGLIALPNDGVVAGTRGMLKVKTPFWCAEELENLETGQTVYKIAKQDVKTNYTNSYILRYEAQEVRKCLLAGKKESPTMTWEDTLNIHEILDEIRCQLGVTYEEDVQAMEKMSAKNKQPAVAIHAKTSKMEAVES